MENQDTKPNRTVEPEQLTQLIEKADRVVVEGWEYLCGGEDDGNGKTEIKEVTYFESNNKSDLDTLKHILRVKYREDSIHLLCNMADLRIVFYNGKESLGSLGIDGSAISCDLWDSDAELIDPERWVSWFYEQRIHPSRDELEFMREEIARNQKLHKKWISAMPEGLQSVWKDTFDKLDYDPENTLTKALRNALEKSIPDKANQITALLTWFGSGKESWSNYPSYESVVEELLVDYEISEIFDAIDVNELTYTQIEAVARLFISPRFYRKYRNGIKYIPIDLSKAICNHVRNDRKKTMLIMSFFKRCLNHKNQGNISANM